LEEKKRTMKKDLIAIAVIIAAGILIWILIWLNSGGGKTAEIRIDGVVTARYSLDINRKTELHGADGGINLLVIKDGEVWVEEADCPDGLCMRTGKISKKGQSIVCLPHKVVIEITGDNIAQEDSNIPDIVVK